MTDDDFRSAEGLEMDWLRNDTPPYTYAFFAAIVVLALIYVGVLR